MHFWENSCGMAVDIFTKCCTHIEIMYIDKYKIVLSWSIEIFAIEIFSAEL